VLGNTYAFSCEGDWYEGTDLVTETAPGDGESGVFVVAGSSKDDLTFQLFSEDQAREYACRDDRGAEFAMSITTGNPVLIPGREVIGLDLNEVRHNSPNLHVFGSGNPQPTPSEYSWSFNDVVIFENGSAVGSVEGIVEVLPTQITLRNNNLRSAGGLYTSTVRTTAGETNVSITVNIEVKPSPVLSVLSPADYSEEHLIAGDTVVFSCNETAGVPPPSLSWTLNGRPVSPTTPGAAVSPGNEGQRVSYLNLSSVNFSNNGTVVKCVATSEVEDENVSINATETLIVLAPPPPPTNLTGLRLSDCRAGLAWVAPPPTDAWTLSPESLLLEARAGGEGGEWVPLPHDLSPQDTSLEVS
jgi:hypothetical protein